MTSLKREANQEKIRQTDRQNSALASAVLAAPILGLVRRENVWHNPAHHHQVRASTEAVTCSVQL